MIILSPLKVAEKNMEEARERLILARGEYNRKMSVRFIGIIYSIPAWRRYSRAFRDYSKATTEYLRENVRYRLFLLMEVRP